MLRECVANLLKVKALWVRTVPMQTYLRTLMHSNLQRLFKEVEALYRPVRPQQLTGNFAGVLTHLISGEFHGVSVVVRPIVA